MLQEHEEKDPRLEAIDRIIEMMKERTGGKLSEITIVIKGDKPEEEEDQEEMEHPGELPEIQEEEDEGPIKERMHKRLMSNILK